MKRQCLPPDIISNMPLSIIQTILTLMPIRDAFRTSILSRKWRYNCINIPKLEFDDNLLQGQGNSELSNKCKIFHVVYNVLLLHDDPVLEFSLCFSKLRSCYEIDRIILYLSRNTNVRKFTLCLGSGYTLPSYFFSLQKLTHLKLENCEIQPQTTISGFSSLTSLWLDDVCIPTSMLLRFLTACPLLKSFTIFNFYGYGSYSNFDELFRCLPLIEHLRMDYEFRLSLAIDVTHHRRLPSLPNMLVHLRVLKLDGLSFECEDDVRYVLLLVASSPLIRNINLEMFYDPGVDILETDMIHLDLQEYSYVILDQLCEVEITNFVNMKLGMDFVKFILAKSPMLKTILIVINNQVSVDDEVKMLRDLIWNPRASPGAQIKFERP